MPKVPMPAKVLTAVFLALFWLTACEKNAYVPPPAPKVNVAKPVSKQVVDYLNFTGNTQAVQSVDLKARVEGYLQGISFQDGQLVKKGQPLFVIEPEPYKAKVQQAQAQVEGYKATLEQAEIEYNRAQRLFKERAGPDTDVVKWQTSRDTAKAQLAGAQAQLELAKINYGYTQVSAPFNGRIGRHMVDLGNLVGAGQMTLLTTVIQYDPMYVYYTLNERELLRLIRLSDSKRGRTQNKLPLEMGLSDSEGYPYKGEVDFADLGVDPQTGTMLLRGSFPNTDLSLVPGLFVRLRAQVDVRQALLVPETAVGVDQGGHYVLVVGDKNIVAHRQVEVGQVVDGMQVIDKGLDGSELVVVNGIQYARPGAEVVPEEAAPAKP